MRPIYNTVVFFLNIIPSHDVGIAIILTTLLIKIILLKPNISSQKSNYLMKEAQIEIDKIKEENKGDNKKIAEKTMALYKAKKIKPFSSILVLIIQIPIFFALYYVFKDNINNNSNLLYSFNKLPNEIKHLAFGFLDMSQKYWLIGVLAGVSMFIYSKRQANTLKRLQKEKKDKDGKIIKDESFQAVFLKNMQGQMLYFLPVISGFSAAVLPAVLGIYWTTNNILNILQDIYIKRKLNIEEFINKQIK